MLQLRYVRLMVMRLTVDNVFILEQQHYITNVWVEHDLNNEWRNDSV